MKKEAVGTDKYESKEELWLSYYLDELKATGFIIDWKYQHHTYQLFDKITYPWIKKTPRKLKHKEGVLLQPHEYTPDFLIEWGQPAHNIFYNTINDQVNLKDTVFIAHPGNNLSIVDVKPQFDMQNMTRLFVLNQKWMMSKFGIFIQKIILVKETKHFHKIGHKNKKVYSHSTWSGIFPKTFTPERFFTTDVTEKQRKIKYDAIKLNEFIENIKNESIN